MMHGQKYIKLTNVTVLSVSIIVSIYAEEDTLCRYYYRWSFFLEAVFFKIQVFRLQ